MQGGFAGGRAPRPVLQGGAPCGGPGGVEGLPGALNLNGRDVMKEINRKVHELRKRYKDKKKKDKV